jgi:hypothetical protein
VKRFLAAAAAVLVLGSTAFVSADSAPDAEVGHVEVQPGEGWLAVAGRVSGIMSGPQRSEFAIALATANGLTLQSQLYPGRVLVYTLQSVPQPTTTTTTTTTVPPSTTTTSTTSSTTTTLPPTTTTSSTSTTTVAPQNCPARIDPALAAQYFGCPNQPDGPDPWGGRWPGPSNTGVPAGTVLRTHTGSCTLPAGTYDAVLFNCDLLITVPVTITRSHVNGLVRINAAPAYLTISDSFVDATPGAMRTATAIWAVTNSGGATIDRVEIVGGRRSVYCDPCTMRDSWAHAQETALPDHAGAVRASQHSIIQHNTLNCEPSNCSADLTGYPDEEPTFDWLIQRNLFVSGPGQTVCAYGGATAQKDFSDHPDNATDIRFVDNVFRRDVVRSSGSSAGQPSCGPAGDVIHFDGTRPGNVFQGNVFADTGGPVTPRN